MSEAKRVLLATWGLPKGWRCVRYALLENPPGKWKRREREHMCVDVKDDTCLAKSTSVALDYFSSPELVGVFLSSTLLHEYDLLERAEGRKLEDLDRELGEAVFERSGSEEDSCNELFGKLKDVKRVRTYCLPGVGTFHTKGGNHAYEGEPGLYFLRAYWETWKLIEELEGELELIVDLSHGVNYQPSLLTDAADLAARVYSVARVGGVRVVAINSDPAVNPEEGATVGLRVVSSYKVKPRTAFSRITEEVTENVLSGDPCRFLKWSDPFLRDNFSKLVTAVEAGLFLSVSHFEGEIRSNLERLERKLEGVREIAIVREPGESKVKYAGAEGLFKELAYVHAFLKALEKAGESEVEGEMSDEELNRKAEDYGQVTSRELIKSELDRVKGMDLKGEWESLSELLEGGSEADSSPNSRNLIAHGGLERNVTLVRRDGRLTKFRYKSAEAVLRALAGERP